jgi:hypothetical protein
MQSDASPRYCAVCGERLGVYEPLIVLSERVLWRTSLAQDPEFTPADVVMHAKCASAPEAETEDPG